MTRFSDDVLYYKVFVQREIYEIYKQHKNECVAFFLFLKQILLPK